MDGILPKFFQDFKRSFNYDPDPGRILELLEREILLREQQFICDNLLTRSTTDLVEIRKQLIKENRPKKAK